MNRFLDELKRRGVIRAAILYVGFAFGTLEIVDMLGPRLGLPESAFVFVLTFFTVGFPVAMWLSWSRQITLEGIRPEPDAESARPVPESDRRRSDRIIIAVLAFAVVAFAANEFMPRVNDRKVMPLYELGRKQLIQRTETSVVEAEKNFRRAIELDPEFAPAYAGLAEAITIKAFKDMIPRHAAFEDVRGVVEIGLNLDPSIGEFYANLANVKWEVDDDLDEAERLYRQAIELSPMWVRGYQWYAEFLVYGKPDLDKAHAVLFTGLDQKAFDPYLVDRVIWVAIRRGNVADYEGLLRESIRRHPEFLKNITALIRILEGKGRVGEVLKWSEYRSQKEPENFSRRILNECWARITLEQQDESRECVEELERQFAADPRKVMIARMFLGDDIEETIEIAESLMASGPAASVMQSSTPQDAEIVGLLSGIISDQLADEGPWDLARRFGEWEGNAVFTDPNWQPSPADVDRNSKIIPATINAAILYKTGDEERGDELFDLVLERIRAQGLTNNAGYSYRVVWIHAFRGNLETARSYLEVSMKNQVHLEDWHRLEGPVFEAVKDDPRWQAMLEDIRERAAAELAWYKKNKDEALF